MIIIVMIIVVTDCNLLGLMAAVLFKLLHCFPTMTQLADVSGFRLPSPDDGRL